MAKLKEIAGLEKAQPKKSKKEVLTTRVKGDVVRRYVEACDQIEAAQVTCKELAPELREVGLEFVFKYNCAHPLNVKEQINSVVITDGEDEPDPSAGQSVMFTWQRKALKADSKAVEAHINTLKTTEGKQANPNDYAAWGPVADFDSKVFMVPDAKGKLTWSEERFKAFEAAVKKVADQLKVENPLTCKQTFAPLPDFNERRFRDFTAKQNIALAEVLPTSVGLEPVRSEEE